MSGDPRNSSPRVREAYFSDIPVLAENMRVPDIIELAAASGRSPEQALRHAMIRSTKKWSIVNNNKCVGMFGLTAAPGRPEVGVPWLLSSEEIGEFPIKFLRGTRRYIRMFQNEYPVLTNYVDIRHVEAQRWLEWCGFIKYKIIPEYGVGKVPFIQYVRYRDSV